MGNEGENKSNSKSSSPIFPFEHNSNKDDSNPEHEDDLENSTNEDQEVVAIVKSESNGNEDHSSKDLPIFSQNFHQHSANFTEEQLPSQPLNPFLRTPLVNGNEVDLQQHPPSHPNPFLRPPLPFLHPAFMSKMPTAVYESIAASWRR